MPLALHALALVATTALLPASRLLVLVRALMVTAILTALIRMAQPITTMASVILHHPTAVAALMVQVFLHQALAVVAQVEAFDFVLEFSAEFAHIGFSLRLYYAR